MKKKGFEIFENLLKAVLFGVKMRKNEKERIKIKNWSLKILIIIKRSLKKKFSI